MYLNASAECVLCREGKDDYKHLFFLCPFAYTIWASQDIITVEAIYETNFWDSIQQGSHQMEEDGGQILAVIWAIWLHQNEVMFKGRLASIDSVVHEVEGLGASWLYHI